MAIIIRLVPAIFIIIGGSMLLTIHVLEVRLGTERPWRLLAPSAIVVGGILLLVTHLYLPH